MRNVIFRAVRCFPPEIRASRFARMKYIANLTAGRIVLWCYLIWYLFFATRYFDRSPELWFTSLGLSGIIGFALMISIWRGKDAIENWQMFQEWVTRFIHTHVVEGQPRHISSDKSKIVSMPSPEPPNARGCMRRIRFAACRSAIVSSGARRSASHRAARALSVGTSAATACSASAAVNTR